MCSAEFRGFHEKKRIPDNEARQEPEYKTECTSKHLGAIRARPKLESCFGKVRRWWYLCKERPVPKFGAGGVAPTFKNNFAIPIECNDCCVRKEHSATCIDKESQSNEGVWEACHDVAFSAGCGQGSYQCQFTTCNGVNCGAVGNRSPNYGSGGVIIYNKCSGGIIYMGGS